ncbi:hypothetical protein [Kitasatospora sp. NBC_01266]|uniref:hypothetical protein n=1 Tax=Kitasatospora sp. NBC_01266 TaxID=2903572 RepID=UPI002E351834|nr:hypothetical protein [Kitasatospora sp. NBC_01266]
MTLSEEPQIGAAPANADSTWAGFVRSTVAQITEHAPGKELVGPIAYAVDAAWRVIAYNDAFADAFTGRRVPENMFKWMVWEGRAQLPEHDRYWVRRVVPQLDSLLEEFPDQPELMELAQWTERTVGGPLRLAGRTGPDGEIRPLIHGRYGFGSLWIGAATPMSSSGRVVFAHFYAGATPDEVRALLQSPEPRRGAA